MRKLLISLGLTMALTTAVMANSTIYTDDIGRMHFLGKDPGGRTLQQVQNFSNPAEKDLTNIIYNENSKEVDYTGTFSGERKIKVSTQSTGESSKSKAAYTAEKGAMDASNPFTYGESNLKEKANEVKVKTEKKYFWENWWQ